MFNIHNINLSYILYIIFNILTCIDSNHQIEYYYHHRILQGHLWSHLHINLGKEKLLKGCKSSIILSTKIYNLCNHHLFLSFHLHILHHLIIISLHILININCQRSQNLLNMLLGYKVNYAIYLSHLHIIYNIIISLNLQMMGMLNRNHYFHNILINKCIKVPLNFCFHLDYNLNRNYLRMKNKSNIFYCTCCI